MHQIALSQRVTKNKIKAKIDGMEANMEEKMEGLKDGLKLDMEGLKEGLTKLLQEMIPNGERVLDETHDDNKKMLIMIP